MVKGSPQYVRRKKVGKEWGNREETLGIWPTRPPPFPPCRGGGCTINSSININITVGVEMGV